MSTDALWNALSSLSSLEPDIAETALQSLREHGAEAVSPLNFTLHVGETPARQSAVRALAYFDSHDAVTCLISALHDSDEVVRQTAVQSLVTMGSAAVEPLLAALREHETEADIMVRIRGLNDSALTTPVLERIAEQQGQVKRGLFQSLAEIGDERASPTLVCALLDADSDIRFWAAQSLARQGGFTSDLLTALDDSIAFRQQVAESLTAHIAKLDTASISLLRLASHVGRAPVRWVADYVLSRMDTENAPGALDYALSDTDAEVRLIAVQAVHGVTESNIEPLLKAARDNSPAVRRAAVRALADSSDTRAVTALVQAANDEDALVRGLALQAVGHLDQVAELSPLIHALSNRDHALRRTAADSLLAMDAEHVLTPLIDALAHDPYGDAARSLGRLNDKRAVEPLLNALEGATYVSRQAIIEALGNLADRRALSAFIGALKDDTTGVREAAVKGLARLAAPESIVHLVDALADPSPAVREGAAHALEQMGPLVLQAMLPSLESSDWRVRLNAVQILGRIGDVRAVELLIQKLHDPAGNVCGAVVTELKKLADARCVGWLLRALEDKDAYVRENVADVLTQLGDSYSLPRLVLAETRLSERERAGILDYMRHVRYSDRHITFRFTAIGDVTSFCRQMNHDPDTAVQTGARALLSFIEKLRQAQAAAPPPPSGKTD